MPADLVLNRTQALPGFYCKNKGHRPAYVPFSVVNDGVCDAADCCDGSDESARVGGVKCPDTCKEVGKAWRKQDEARQKAMNNAMRRRTELVKEAARLRAEVETKISAIGREMIEVEGQVKTLEARVADEEKKDKMRVLRGGKGKAGKVGALAGLAKERVDELRKGLLEVRRQRDAKNARLVELEELLKAFKEDYNPNFNDEGVKRAVRGWEAYAARDKGPADDQDFEKDLDDIVKEDSEHEGINWAEWESSDDEKDTDIRMRPDVFFPSTLPARRKLMAYIVYSIEAYLPPSIRSWVSHKIAAAHTFLIQNGVIANPPSAGGDSSSSESAALTSARNDLTSAQNRQRDLTNDRNNAQFDLARPYGPADVFRALRGACVTRDAGEYTYAFCWLDKTTQRPRKGGAETTMGGWTGVETVHVDETLPADGKGVGSGARWALKYENGQTCWNGPARSTTVVLACAEADELWRIVEEEKCVYRMEVGTPAVCGAGPGEEEGQGKGRVKDEL